MTLTPEERQEIERVLNIGTPLTRRERESFALAILPRLLADYDHLREQNHEHAARRDREAAALQSEVDRWRNRAQRAKERVRGTPVDWSKDARSQEPDGWWNYTSEVNRDIFIAMLADYDHLVEVARALSDHLYDGIGWIERGPTGMSIADAERLDQLGDALRALIDPVTPEPVEGEPK